MNLVGPAEIAELLSVHPVTVYKWYADGKLPEPAAVLRMGPVWETATILKWNEQR